MLTIYCPGCSLCITAPPETMAADPGCPRCGMVLDIPPSPPARQVPLDVPEELVPCTLLEPGPEAAPEPEPALSFVDKRRLRKQRQIARRLILKVVLVALLGVAAAFAVRAAINRVEEVQSKKASEASPRARQSRAFSRT